MKDSYQFGNVVIVDVNQIGVVVKSWEDDTHDIYVRSYNGVKSYHVTEIMHYVYNKEITKKELRDMMR